MKLLIAFFIVFLPFAAKSAEKDQVKICMQITELAGVIMTKRQNGVEILQFMEVLEAEGVKDPAFERILRLAYEKPRFTSSEYINQAVSDFKNEIYLLCRSGK